jgi:hypothetical protein
MSTRFYTSGIGLFLRDRIKTVLEAAIGAGTVKRVMLGDLRRFAQRKDFLTTKVPAVYILRQRFDAATLLSLNQHYEVPYTYRIVYVDTVRTDLTDSDDTHEDNVVDRAEKVADAIIENIVLAQPSPITALTNGQMLRVELVSCEFECPENDLMLGLHADGYAAALTVRVVTAMWATP